MFKKITLLILFLLVFMLSVAEASSTLEQARSEVISLIKEGNRAQAKTQTEKMLADHRGEPALANALYLIAWEYELSDKYADADKYAYAKNVYYQQIQKGHYDSPYMSRAKLGVARTTVLPLIKSRKYDQAKEAYDKMAADFTGHPDWPATLYWVAERYKWAGRYEDAKDFYRLIIKDYPDSPFAERARLGIPRAEVWFLIRSYEFDKAKKALDKMVTDFKGHPDLPETLYGCAEKYGLSDDFEEEKALYQHIMRDYPDSEYAKKAELSFARANILFLVLSHNYDDAKEAYTNLLAGDLVNHPDFPNALLSIARRYEWEQQYNEAKVIYQKVIQDYPNSPYSSKAELGVSRTQVACLVGSEDYKGSDAAFDNLLADFGSHPDLPRTILATGEQFYREGISKESAGLQSQAKDRFEKAVKIWEKLINEYPDSSFVPEACCWAGDCYSEKLNRYEDSIRCYQKVADKYPKYRHAWHAQFMVGRCYEVLKKRGAVDESVAEEKIKTAYQRVKDNYPDCSAAGYAGNWLSNKAKSKKEK